LGARPEPEEGTRTQARVLLPGGGKHASVGDTLSCERGAASLLPVQTHGYGTNRPETAVAVSAIDSGRVACDRCNGRTQVIPHLARPPSTPPAGVMCR
jgi:hypothetical protein